MTDAELQAIRELADKATPGPWEHRFENGGPGVFFGKTLEQHICRYTSGRGNGGKEERSANAAFIAAAREAVPALLDEVAELREEMESSDQLSDRQSKLLTGVVNAIRGEPPELQLWSHHDAPELAAGIMAEAAQLREALAGLIRFGGEDREPCWCEVDMSGDEHGEGCQRARTALAASPAVSADSKPAITSAGGEAAPHALEHRVCACEGFKKVEDADGT